VLEGQGSAVEVQAAAAQVAAGLEAAGSAAVVEEAADMAAVGWEAEEAGGRMEVVVRAVAYMAG
jgi:hypothetical protein